MNISKSYNVTIIVDIFVYITVLYIFAYKTFLLYKTF